MYTLSVGPGLSNFIVYEVVGVPSSAKVKNRINLFEALDNEEEDSSHQDYDSDRS